MKTDTIKGFKDFTGKEAEKRAVIQEVVKQSFEKYGFEPAETPVIENEDFVRGDNKNDEAVSDIYTLKDNGKRKLALRYEFTFQLKRLMKNKKIPYKRFQIGPVFRDEPVKGNRLRQFTTCEADILGSTIKDESEMIACISDILNKLKINAIIYINNRKLLNEILKEFNTKDNEKVIREIDKLDKLSEKEVKENLKKLNCEGVLSILKKPESYFEKYESYSEIKELKKYLSYYKIKCVFLPSLARGLSYYNGSVFEIKTKKIKETICGGGAYEFEGVRGFGFGTSIDRLSTVTEMLVSFDKTLVVSLNQDKKAIEIAQKLRKAGKIITLYYGKPSKALDYANSYGFSKVIFIGKREIEKKKLKIKNMNTGKELNIEINKIEKKI
ncbi:MAG: ATP phosphoribosyltransferase regulatory subunit [Nanoarchaeota archaeon]